MVLLFYTTQEVYTKLGIVSLYSGESGEIEIIYQYANFVHRDGGFIPPTYLSTPQNMEDFKAGNNLASLCLSGGLLILFLYFLLCADRKSVV